jgi:hypothetical protein
MTDEFASLYTRFQAPISALDCGSRCAPYNEHGVPFCCDTRHAIPSVYQAEWQYLQANTDLWHAWESNDPGNAARLRNSLPDGQVLVECLGHQLCQRNYRSITCRSFPFFPYITLQGEFIGISYYWEYEDRCWVISNLGQVTRAYLESFIEAYDTIFRLVPEEVENFRQHSIRMCRNFGIQRRAIPLLHRNGFCYKISPATGRKRRVNAEELPKFGPYRIAARLPFPGE